MSHRQRHNVRPRQHHKKWRLGVILFLMVFTAGRGVAGNSGDDSGGDSGGDFGEAGDSGEVGGDSGEAVDWPKWKRYFDRYDARGTIVVADEREQGVGTRSYNVARARTRFSPASTFKIPHALFALDAGVIRDEFEIIVWDGKKRFYPPWNRDQNLRSSMRHSVVWVYQKFAREIGEEREREYLVKAGYGNARVTDEESFWLNGDLRISAGEQITFLKKLYRNTLPFKIEHQRLVKDIMLVEAGADWRLRAKTGWTGKMGWWVGWVETATGPVFFALNIDTPHKNEDLPKRQNIPRAVLRSIGALPDASATQ